MRAHARPHPRTCTSETQKLLELLAATLRSLSDEDMARIAELLEGASGHGVTEYRLIISDTEKVRDPEWGKWATTNYWNLDLTRLLLQLFGLTLVTGVSYVITGERKVAQATDPKNDDAP